MVLEAQLVAAWVGFGEKSPHLGWLHMAKDRDFGLSRHRWWFLLK